MLALIHAVRSPSGPALDERLCGLSLIERAVLLAQSKGAERILVLVGEADLSVARAVEFHSRVRVRLEVTSEPTVPGAQFPSFELHYDRVAEVLLCDTAARREAKRRLFDACRKPVDGFISRHLNRPISIAISKLLVDTPVSPNALTVFTFSLSFAAAFFAVQGGYWPTLAAAFLMQWNSILDGCDGELARVRHQGSKVGQWLDTIGDDASNVIFWAALGYGARAIPEVGGWLALAGYVGAAGNGVAALANYAVLAQLGSGDFYALDAGAKKNGVQKARSGWVGRLVGLVELVLKQDFFLFLMLIVALLGLMHAALIGIAIGAVVTAINSLLRAVGFFTSTRRSRGGSGQ